MPRAAATWFGGDDDPGDNGQTASGVLTRGHPSLLGCALPLAGYGLQSLRGTPLPMMAFGLHHDGLPNPDGAWVEVMPVVQASSLAWVTSYSSHRMAASTGRH